MRTLFLFVGLLLLVLCFSPACGNPPEPPLDASTRQRIDSLSATQIRALRTVLDSQCLADRRTQMPHLMDSIRQLRMREIEEKLRSIPH